MVFAGPPTSIFSNPGFSRDGPQIQESFFVSPGLCLVPCQRNGTKIRLRIDAAVLGLLVTLLAHSVNHGQGDSTGAFGQSRTEL